MLLERRAAAKLGVVLPPRAAVKYTGPSLNATQNAVAIEAIEIAHEGLHLVPGFGRGAIGGALAGSVG